LHTSTLTTMESLRPMCRVSECRVFTRVLECRVSSLFHWGVTISCLLSSNRVSQCRVSFFH